MLQPSLIHTSVQDQVIEIVLDSKYLISVIDKLNLKLTHILLIHINQIYEQFLSCYMIRLSVIDDICV